MRFTGSHRHTYELQSNFVRHRGKKLSGCKYIKLGVIFLTPLIFSQIRLTPMLSILILTLNNNEFSSSKVSSYFPSQSLCAYTVTCLLSISSLISKSFIQVLYDCVYPGKHQKQRSTTDKVVSIKATLEFRSIGS